MEEDKRREIAERSANVPHEKRSFAKNRTLAAEAGRKGGLAVSAEARTFSADRDLASQAGRKGGQASQLMRRRRMKERQGPIQD
jgi:general stress protein YciG